MARLELTHQAREDLDGLSDSDWQAAVDLAERYERTGAPLPARNSSAPGVLELHEGPIRMHGVFARDVDGDEFFLVARVLTDSE